MTHTDDTDTLIPCKEQFDDNTHIRRQCKSCSARSIPHRQDDCIGKISSPSDSDIDSTIKHSDPKKGGKAIVIQTVPEDDTTSSETSSFTDSQQQALWELIEPQIEDGLCIDHSAWCAIPPVAMNDDDTPP